ncbi:MAG: hypothetical protein AAFR36_27450, partial [Bacteroidota bacterium]
MISLYTKHLFLLLWLCCCGLPQVLLAETSVESKATSYTLEVSTSLASSTLDFAIAAAEDFCTDPTDIATCSVNIPGNPNELTIAAGQAVLLALTVTNTGPEDLVFATIEDSQFGILRDAPTIISAGGSLSFRFLVAAPTIPRVYDINLTFTGEDASGNRVVLTNNYTITVPEPEAISDLAIAEAEDFCTDPTDITTCSVNIPGNPNELTVNVGQPILLNLDITNTGIGSILTATVEDSQSGTLRDGPINIPAGIGISFRFLVNAPTTPGTYNIDLTFTGTDGFNNTVVLTETYTLTVFELAVSLNTGIVAANDVCTDPDEITTCSVGIPGSPNTLTLGPGEPIYFEFDVINTGSEPIIFSTIEDTQYGVIRSGSTFIGPGVNVTFRSLQTAPFLAGTYNIEVTYTGRDALANEVIVTDSYTIIVPEPMASISPAVAFAD